MEKKTLPNDLAYPAFKIDEDGKQFVDSNMLGLTKRELFAAMAMQGMISDQQTTLYKNGYSPENVAMYSRQYADALIAELNTNQ